MSNELNNNVFMKQEDTNSLFAKIFREELGHDFENWFKVGKAHEKVYQYNDRIGNLNFGDIVDSFYEWRYKTPYDKTH